jgi:integral membrane protein
MHVAQMFLQQRGDFPAAQDASIKPGPWQARGGIGIALCALVPLPCTKLQDSLHLQIGQVFTAAARFEAFTWTGLLIGMLLKHVLDLTELGVWLFGRLHGAAFLVYFFVSLVAAIRLRWPWWAAVLAVLAAIPPLVTYPLELWFRRRGILERT